MIRFKFGMKGIAIRNLELYAAATLEALETNGFGECCFIMPNDNDKSRSLNRRVEIYIEEQSRHK